MARKNKKKKTLAFKNAVAGYLFIAPFIVGFILFLVVPLVQSLRMSFSTVELEGGLSMTWAGLENYRQAFLVDEQFVPNLISELVKMLTISPSKEEEQFVQYSSCRLFFHPVLSLVWKAEIRFWLT